MSLALAVGVSCFIAGCGEKSKESQIDKYVWGYSPVMTDICDDDMTIDGVFDEARWEGKKFLVHEEDGVRMSYTTAFSEKGLYIAAKAEDPDIQWQAQRYYEANSSFWFSIKGPNVTYKFNTQEFTLFVDPVDATMVQMNKYQAVGKTDKPMKESPTVLTAEAFLSWDTLNIELGENGELPEYVLINPHYRHIVEQGSADNAWLRPMLFFDDNDRQQNSGRFGAEGYLNADAENAFMGNAGNGISKSDGWDLSKESDGIVRSISDNSQAIFIRDVYSDAYAFEVKAKVKGGVGYMNDSNGLPTETKKVPSAVGIVNMVDEISFNTFKMKASDIFEQSPSINYGTLSFYVNGRGGWKNTELGMMRNVAYKELSTVTFTCLKNGGNFYYIVNGQMLYTEYVSYLNGASCPGFFALDSEVEFFDYSLTDFSDDPEGLVKMLEEYDCYMVDVNTDTEGGIVRSSTGAVDDGGDVEISIIPESGYLLTGFTVNGEDYYNEIMRGMSGGVYVFEGVSRSLVIDAEFTRITNNLLVYVKGRVRSTTDEIIGSAIISVDDLAGMYHIESGVTSVGGYRIGLPKTGEFELGGRQFNFDGQYRISADATGYHGIEKYVTIPSSGEDVEGVDFQLRKVEANEMDSFTAANGDVSYVPDSGWMKHSVVYLNENNKADAAVFSVEVTAKNGIQFSDWGWTGVGIMVSNGNKITGTKYIDTLGNARNIPSNNYHNALFGFDTTTGIIVYSGFNMNMNNNINRNVKIPSVENPTKTLTLLLIDDMFYLFMEDAYMGGWKVSDSLFTPNKKDNNDTVNAKFSEGDKFMFGVGAFNLSAQTPVSIRVVKELYGNDALTEIADNSVYKEAIQPSNIRMTKNAQGEYVMPTGWMNYGYAYTTTTLTDAAIYSVDFTAVNGCKGSNGWAGNAGIAFSNGKTMGSDYWYAYGDTERKNKRGSGCTNYYSGAAIGFNGSHLAVTSGGLSAAKNYSATTWPNLGTALQNGLTASNLTVVFYENLLYIFLDGVYINSISLDDGVLDYKNGNNENVTFDLNDKLVFGVSAANLADECTVKAKVVKEVYGSFAKTEIQATDLYWSAIHYDEWANPTPIESRSATANSDGSYSLYWESTTAGGMAYQYFDGQSDTVVFSVDITMPVAEIYETIVRPRVGITVTNGALLKGTYAAATSQVTPGEYQSSQIMFFQLTDGTGTLCSYIDGLKNKGRDCVSVSGYAIANAPFSATKGTANLTVVLYNHRFYAYSDGVFIYSWAQTDALLSTTYTLDGKQISTAYSATDTFKFGICANGTYMWTPKFNVVTRLYGEAALNELKSNSTYANLGLSASSASENSAMSVANLVQKSVKGSILVSRKSLFVEN